MVDLVTLRALAEAANRPEPPPTDDYRDAWLMWSEAREAYLASVSGPAVVLALLAVVEAARDAETAMYAAELHCEDAMSSVAFVRLTSELGRVHAALAALDEKETTNAR